MRLGIMERIEYRDKKRKVVYRLVVPDWTLEALKQGGCPVNREILNDPDWIEKILDESEQREDL